LEYIKNNYKGDDIKDDVYKLDYDTNNYICPCKWGCESCYNCEYKYIEKYKSELEEKLINDPNYLKTYIF
jgi:hypothetical protein